MIKSQQTTRYLKQLEQQYPQAFKWNFIFYGQLKTKGLLDEAKEFIPWVIAIIIFCSIYFLLGQYIQQNFPQYDTFQANGISALAIMLFFMFLVPFIIHQIKHSSTHLYQQLHNVPLKLTVLIILQALNIYFIESTLLQGILFFFTISFGFVKLFKENLFRDSIKNHEYRQLQQIRRTCFWSYKQVKINQLKMKFLNKNSKKYKLYKTRLAKFLELHIQLLKHENDFCKRYKYTDLDAYMDSMM